MEPQSRVFYKFITSGEEDRFVDFESDLSCPEFYKRVGSLFKENKQFHFQFLDPLTGRLTVLDPSNFEGIHRSVKLEGLSSVKSLYLLRGENPTVSSRKGSTTDLIQYYKKCWNDDEFQFPEDNFNPLQFIHRLSLHAEQFQKKGIDFTKHSGFIDKIDLDPAKEPLLFVHGDLRGRLECLVSHLEALKKEGLLDKNYKCIDGVHLIFLGNYCDAGSHSTQILELLMRLREENPKQIHLIRGARDYIRRDNEDNRYNQLIAIDDGITALAQFYTTMSLSTYVSVADKQRREYVQFTHGLFELTMDPEPLLCKKEASSYLAVPIKRVFSERFEKIWNTNETAKRVRALISEFKHCLNGYCYGRIGPQTGAQDLKFSLHPDDIKKYLKLCSEQHRVKMLVRGNSHFFECGSSNKKVVVITLSNNMNSFILGPDVKFKNWTRQPIIWN